MRDNNFYIRFSNNLEITVIACRFDVIKREYTFSIIEEFVFYNRNDDIVCFIDKSYVDSIYHFSDICDIRLDNKTFDYNSIPFPEVECRFKVFSDCFETEFNKYSEALEFARFNACAVFDCESCKIIDDYRVDQEE